MCTLIVVVLILFISWAYLKYAEIPFTLAAKSVAYMEISSLAVTSTSLAGQTVRKNKFLDENFKKIEWSEYFGNDC